MAFITTIPGTYAGDMAYNTYNYTVSDSFIDYIESIDIVYDPIYNKQLTGFDDTKYQQNDYSTNHSTGEISFTLTGDTPHWLMQQLVQLAKGILGNGMALQIDDNTITTYNDNTHYYYGKWENASDFVENNAVLAGGNIRFRFYYSIQEPS